MSTLTQIQLDIHNNDALDYTIGKLNANLRMLFGSLNNVVANERYLKNFNPTKLLKFRSAVARQAVGGTSVTVAMVGDSVTAGGQSATLLSGYRPNSWVSKLASKLTTRGIPANMNNAFGGAAGTQNAGQPPGYWDNRLTSTGGFSAGLGPFVWGGASFFTNGVTGTISFAPGVSTDTCAITYFDQVGSFTVDIGGAAQTVTMGNTSTFKTAVLSFSAGVNTYTLTAVSGSWNFAGFDCSLSTAPAMKLWNFGAGGLTTASWANISSIPFLQHKAPDLTFICLGGNDEVHLIPDSLFISSLQALINAVLPTGDVVLVTPPPFAVASVPLNTQQHYVDMMVASAITNNICYIDQYSNLGSKALMTALGMGSDAFHPNNQGHSFIAQDFDRSMSTVL